MTEIQSLTKETINAWADDPKGPVALMLKQKLLPVDGEGGIIFPPTYADIGYSIDVLSDGTKVAQIDSVPSQANRMEPLFKEGEYKALVPQIEFDLGKDKEDGSERFVSLLDLAHRAGDAVVRSSDLAVQMDSAFKTMLRKHDAGPLAKLAPTSLLFGAWDSRGTQVKRPRLIRSFIRAENIDVLHSAAQYNSVWKLLDDQQKKDLTDEAKAKKVKLSDKGFNDVPAVFRKNDKIQKYNKDGHVNDEARVLGGIIAHGPITRQVTINLIALHSLHGGDDDSTTKLRRYLLGLALVAATADMEFYLREGCLLKYVDDDDESWEAVARRGQSQFFSLSAEQDRKTIFAYAKEAAEVFGIVQPEKPYLFDIKKAKALLAKKEETETDAEA
ncbi:MAG: type I-U CRISPR-associated RAMP protein Csb1/Cas7u [Methylobacter sp.]|nr:type I-U CRISPR-associated RAMP protein Csb1/Cas7u [Methylobacter sp.]